MPEFSSRHPRSWLKTVKVAGAEVLPDRPPSRPWCSAYVFDGGEFSRSASSRSRRHIVQQSDHLRFGSRRDSREVRSSRLRRGTRISMSGDTFAATMHRKRHRR